MTETTSNTPDYIRHIDGVTITPSILDTLKTLQSDDFLTRARRGVSELLLRHMMHEQGFEVSPVNDPAHASELIYRVSDVLDMLDNLKLPRDLRRYADEE